eukprot:8885236-Pyramimonas_sp.AAC.1
MVWTLGVMVWMLGVTWWTLRDMIWMLRGDLAAGLLEVLQHSGGALGDKVPVGGRGGGGDDTLHARRHRRVEAHNAVLNHHAPARTTA